METVTNAALQTPDCHLVQTSWAEIEPVADLIADLLFARLFQMDPNLRGLFPNDLYRVKRGILYTLARLVRESEHEAWRTDITALGRRHLALGVNARHYELFGAALIWTLEKSLGEQFTSRTRQSWKDWYAALVMVMLSQDAIPVPEQNDRYIETQAQGVDLITGNVRFSARSK